MIMKKLSWQGYEPSKFQNITCPNFENPFGTFDSFGHFNVASIEDHKVYYKERIDDTSQVQAMWVYCEFVGNM
jgi:hypothetical protein